jgi:anti-sigma factor RsiW
MKADTKLTNAACPEYEALLEDYLNGALCDANVAAASQHLEACPECRRAADAALAGARWLREMGESLGERPRPSPAFPRIVMARIRVAEAARRAEGEGFWRSLVSLGWRFAFTATLAVALLAVYEARWGGAPEPDVASARLMDVRDIFPADAATPPASRADVLAMVAGTDDGSK